jgi:hypothetical protein
MVVMTLLLDEHVPTSVADVLRNRGHTVYLVTDLLPGGSPDHTVAATGDRLGAGTVLVTWDKDFGGIVPRVSKAGAGRFRNLSRISFRCPEPQGAIRLSQEIEFIEFKYQAVMKVPDKRMIVEITKERLSFR